MLFLRVLALSMVLVLVGCGSGSSGERVTPTVPPVADGGSGDGGSDDDGAGSDDGSGEDPPTGTTISIVPSLGQIVSADVTLANAAGDPIEGGSGAIGDDGSLSVEIDDSVTGPMLVTVTGNADATYFDEAAGAFLPMGPDVSIRAYVPEVRDQVGVTILTELAAQIIDSVEGTPTAADIEAVNDAVRETFAPDLTDILSAPTLVNEVNFTSQSLTDSEGGIYAVVLAALANLAAGDVAPALAILEQLASDLADGDIDGQGASGALTDLDYVPENFATLFSGAIQTAASTLADADLLATANAISITVDVNLLQAVIDAGVLLPQSVVDLIDGGDSGDGSSGGGPDISGDYDLTVTGEIITFGVGADFSLTITNILAPNPSQTSEIEAVLEETLTGFTGISGLSVTIVNNTTDRITFDVEFTAQQSGTEVQLNLRYDYVPAGTTPGDGSGSGDSGGDSGGVGDNGAGSTPEEIAALGEVCLFGGSPEAVAIPESLTGVFNVRYNPVNSGAPYADQELVHFTINGDGMGKLNINNQTILSTPVRCSSTSVEVIWKDSAAGFFYSLSSTETGFNEINLNSADGTFLGQFRDPE